MVTWRLIALLTLCAFAAVSALALDQASVEKKRKTLDAYLEQRVESDVFAGAVAVYSKRSEILRKGFGYADRELGVLNGPEMIFRVGSITKPITAVAALALVDEGAFSLDDSVCKFIESCPTAWKNVLVRHVMTHTSGIPDLFGEIDDAPVEKTRESFDEMIAGLEEGQVELTSPPGEEYAYRNFNYMILAYGMEKATGRLWEELLGQYVFRPAGMANTAYDDVWALVPGRARGYRSTNGRILNTSYDDHSAWAAGGLRSTVDDLVRFVQALEDGRLVSDERRTMSWTPYRESYGYGWVIERSYGRRLIQHDGGIDGFSAQISIYPDDKLLIVALGNIENGSSRTIACDLAALWFDVQDHPIFDPSSSGVEVGRARLEQLAGRYVTDDGVLRRILIDNDSLVYRRGDGDPQPLRALSNDTFFFPNRSDVVLRFIESKDGTVERIEFQRCGSVLLTAERQPFFEASSAEQESRDQPVSREDLLILERAAEILFDETVWNRQDNRACPEDAESWSLFCALQKASIAILGEYQHRRVALQEVRFAIEEVSGGEEYEHRLMDFNNTRTFEEIHRVLSIARERVEARLGD